MTTPRIEEMRAKAVWASQCTNIKVITLGVAERLIQEAHQAGIDEAEEWITKALTVAEQELLHYLTEGVMIGSDGQRNCYFIPCERIDDTIKALKTKKKDNE